MAAIAKCDTCNTTVDKVHCPDHVRTECDACQRVSDRLLCEDCADEEFGDDGDDQREPNEDDLADYIEHHVSTDDVGDLAAAIRRGDTAEAEILLDRVASYVPGWADSVSLGRFSWRAKAA